MNTPTLETERLILRKSMTSATGIIQQFILLNRMYKFKLYGYFPPKLLFI